MKSDSKRMFLTKAKCIRQSDQQFLSLHDICLHLLLMGPRRKVKTFPYSNETSEMHCLYHRQ